MDKDAIIQELFNRAELLEKAIRKAQIDIDDPTIQWFLDNAGDYMTDVLVELRAAHKQAK